MLQVSHLTGMIRGILLNLRQHNNHPNAFIARPQHLIAQAFSVFSNKPCTSNTVFDIKMNQAG